MQAAKLSLIQLKPPPRLTISEWADTYRFLSSEASAESGRFSTKRAEYQREIMSCFTDNDVKKVVCMTSAQVGKTEILLNIIGYYIHLDPAPIMCIQPSLSMAASFSKNRLSSMIRDCEPLSERVADSRSRDSSNSIFSKSFRGGSIDLIGSNSAASISSRPVRILLCDEVDRYNLATTEGDPLSLAERRTTTFYNSKVAYVSTPTIKGSSRIEAAFEAGDQRHYYVKCKDCSEEQILEWEYVVWEKGNHESASYHCKDCGSVWNDMDRYKAISNGRWIAHEEFTGTASFFLNALYSPWTRLSDLAEEFTEASKYPEKLRVFLNTQLGQSWSEDQGEKISEDEIQKRQIKLSSENLPENVLMLTCGVDTQDDRLEATLLGWCLEEKVIVLDHKIFVGDPSGHQVWQDLDDYLSAEYEHAIKGKSLNISCTCIDSGGHHVAAVYNFCKIREHRRVFAIKGKGGEGVPVLSRPSTSNIAKTKLFSLGSNALKSLVYGRLKIKEGPGLIQFSDKLDQEYFLQLTSETLVERYTKGKRRVEWVANRRRNEAWDTLNYGFAAFNIVSPNLRLLHSRLTKPGANKKKKQTRTPFTQRKGKWMDI